MDGMDRVSPDSTMYRTRLRQSQKLESIGMLAAGIAHEISNPLCGIMSYAQYIRDQRGGRDPALDDFAHKIIEETQRAATIIRHLASFAQQDQLGGCLAPVRDVIDAAAALLRTTLRHDQIALHFELPEDLPTIYCYPQQIQQVLVNLVTNARDALNEKYQGRSPAKRIVLAARATQGQPSGVRLTVKDHGTGIPEHLQHRVFEPFFTTKPTDRGTGLGLAISKEIVEDHDGVLSVESRVGDWTSFHVDLPAKPRAFGEIGLRTASDCAADRHKSDWTKEMPACQKQN